MSHIKSRLLGVQQSIPGSRVELMVWSKKLKASAGSGGGLNLTIHPVENPRGRKLKIVMILGKSKCYNSFFHSLNC